MLEHNKLVLPIRDDILEITSQWCCCSFEPQHRHLHLVGDILKAEVVRLILSTSWCTLGSRSARISIKLIHDTGFFLISTLIGLITEVPYDPEVGLHV